jgi:hypothetical protein
VDVFHFTVMEWEPVPPFFCAQVFGHLAMHAISKSDLEGLNHSIEGRR